MLRSIEEDVGHLETLWRRCDAVLRKLLENVRPGHVDSLKNSKLRV
jgi:hypothetical protein